MEVISLAFWHRWLQKRSAISMENENFLKWLGIDVSEVNLRGKNALKEATIFACIKILADSIAKLPVKVYQDLDGKQAAKNHYLNYLLKVRPNPFMSASDFWKAVEVQRNLYGNSYVWIDFTAKGKIQGLFPIDSTKVKIYVDDVGLLSSENKVWYVVTDNKNKQYRLTSDEILHFKGFTTDGIVGLSPLECLRNTIENAGYASQFINNSFKNGLQTKGIIQYVGDLSPEAEKTFRERFERMSSGLKNANRVSLLPLGFEYRPIAMNLADAQFLENTQLTIRQIAAAFGIKNHQLNDLSRATHTNISEQQKEFYIESLLPILTMYEQELSYKLFTTTELKEGFYVKFNANAILRADIKTRYESYRIAIQSGFMTPNEVRALEELEPKDGADELICNGNMIKVSQAGLAYQKNLLKGGENDA